MQKRRQTLDVSAPSTPASACDQARRRSPGDSAPPKLQTAPSVDQGPNPLRGHPRHARTFPYLALVRKPAEGVEPGVPVSLDNSVPYTLQTALLIGQAPTRCLADPGRASMLA